MTGLDFQVFKQFLYFYEPSVGGFKFSHISGINSHSSGHGGKLINAGGLIIPFSGKGDNSIGKTVMAVCQRTELMPQTVPCTNTLCS